MALLVFAVTLLVSAFILFLVQPIIGKLVLPRLGGTPQVWNTCMVFFQMVLLAGYAYTHTVSTKIKLRTQLFIHGLLLLVPLYFLFVMGSRPFDVSEWIPPPGANPLFATLGILCVLVGVPFFLVSTSAPLLQKWFVYTGHPAAKDPYFLYAASNLGSLLSLPFYIGLIEPYLRLAPQTWMWAFSYVALVGMVFVCVAMVWQPSGRALKLALAEGPGPQPGGQAPQGPASTAVTATPPAPAAKSTAIKKAPKPAPNPPRRDALDIGGIRTGEEVTVWRRLRWIALAAIPSSMMLGVTTHITTDLSPIPLFWLVPLELYLLSFVLVFSRWPVPWVGTPHTYVLYTQPVFIALMILFDFIGTAESQLFGPIFFNLLAFFSTALVCHGELAKDRPGTQHLTEFYLMMSVGGMLGGMFNGLIAPIVFIRAWEFPLAVIAACLVRPKLKEGGWSDDLVAGIIEPGAAAPAPAARGGKGQPQRPSAAPSVASETTSTAMDYVLPFANAVLLLLLAFLLEDAIVALARSLGSGSRTAAVGMRYFLMFGIVLTIACFYYGRPIRFGLTIAAVLIIQGFQATRHDSSIYADRSYFGIIRIKTDVTRGDDGRPDERALPYTTLIHGHINHGMNCFKPAKQEDWGNRDKDFSRMATTYYHRLGPAGLVMEKFYWWGDVKATDSAETLNNYSADARMPASLVGAAASALGMANLPTGQLVDLWSEPPYATIGLGTGTMASYGRPYQHVHYYEIDNHIRKLSLPLPKDQYYFTYETLTQQKEPPFTADTYREGGGAQPRTYFTYLKDAIRRGSEVEVLMGDARLRMARPYFNHHGIIEIADKEKGWKVGDKGAEVGGGPDNFYHMMVVDAFTSDAIPAHLLTREAFEMYFRKLTEDGILCVHTSNRFVDLPKVVADIATDMGYHYKRGHDDPKKNLTANQVGHFTSEWVMVARKAAYMQHLSTPRGYQPRNDGDIYWETNPSSGGRYLWTDDYYNLLSIIRW